ncbi:hypothetical protein HNQ77_004588 [Silvibacterium bohemicum]|uniref:DUF2029 domain-containing protein n=1 Tax=Silvibacterium bohemicum TaxID=1577686 RepID=A0A841K3U1_9BACT|nr:glycosyltransferase 87 family protein [Silvibacterium bohemicum]MBB6146609.1 hypothetical protein [Silvibacterium bohemicum]
MTTQSTVLPAQTRSKVGGTAQTFFEIIAAAGLATLLLWKGIYRGWMSINSDFSQYYVVARLIRERFNLSRIYDWIWLQRVADHFGVEHQLVGFLGLTPFSALPLLPFSYFPVLQAKHLWLVFNVVLLIATLQLLGKFTGLSIRRTWIIALCAVFPLRNSFLLGQMHLLVFALLAVAYVSHMRRKQVLSGVCIAIAGALKVYPIFFCLYFLLKRRWKSLNAALLCFALCIGISFLVVGHTAMTDYLVQQLPRTLQGESTNPFLQTGTSSTALFHRLFLFEPELNPHPLHYSPLLYAVLYPLWQAVLAAMALVFLRLGFQSDDRETLDWSLYLTLLLLVSSNPATYHFVVLIGAAAPTVAALCNRGKSRAAIMFLTLYVAFCNVGNLSDGGHGPTFLTPLHFLKLWIGIALVAFYCAQLMSSDVATQNDQRSDRKKPPVPTYLARATPVIVALWLVTFYSAHKHLDRVPTSSMANRVVADSAFLRSAPKAASGSILYVAMRSNGYEILRDGSPLALRQNDATLSNDELSFAASSDGRDIWVEETSVEGSRLARTSSANPAAGSCTVEDAEDGALSADGATLAFLREKRGQGSLWIFATRSCDGATATPGKPQRLTPAEWDVRTLSAAPGGGWLLSAVTPQTHGRESLFQISADGSPRLLAQESSDFDSPAVSPDGSRLILRRMIAGRWQLVVFEPASGKNRQLTFSDCNACTPTWKDEETLLYATDCERGMGMTGLAEMHFHGDGE